MFQQGQGRLGVRPGAVALDEAEAQECAQAVQAVAVQAGDQPSRQTKRAQSLALPGHASPSERAAQEVAVETGVVGNHDGAVHEPPQVR